MIEGLRPYSAYRDSGLAWLGEVPAHWRIQRLKTVLRESQFRSDDGSGTLLSLSRSLGLISRRDMTSKLHGAKTLVGYKCYQSGQIVMNRMQAWSGLFGTGDTAGLVSPDYAVFDVLHGHVTKFVLQRIMNPDLVDQFALASKGIGSGFNRLYTDRFGPISISLPPTDEQAAIVRFLNHATRQLDKAIRAKRKTIALLNEQKQAIIHRAVTQGLDATVPFKYPALASLSQLPTHWELWPFVRCAIERADYRGATPEKVESGIFLVTAKNVRKGWIDYENSKEYVRLSEYSKIMRRGLPKKGDVLLTMEAPLGHVALIDREDIALAQRVIRFRMNPLRVLPQFALLAMNSYYFQDQLFERGTGSTAQGIKASKLPQLLLALPPIEEQERIVSQIETDIGPIELTISRVEREITLLIEYRIRLISDVVTGKLDVREAAAHLPTQDPAATEPVDAPDDTDLDEPSEDLAEAEAGA